VKGKATFFKMSNLYQTTRHDILVLAVGDMYSRRRQNVIYPEEVLFISFLRHSLLLLQLTITAACHWTLFWTNTYALLLQDQLSFNGHQGVDGGLFLVSTKTFYTVILRVLHVQHFTSSLTYDLNNIRW